MARKNSFLSLSHEDKLQYRWSSMLEIESGLDHCTVEQLVAVLKHSQQFQCTSWSFTTKM